MEPCANSDLMTRIIFQAPRTALALSRLTTQERLNPIFESFKKCLTVVGHGCWGGELSEASLRAIFVDASVYGFGGWFFLVLVSSLTIFCGFS